MFDEPTSGLDLRRMQKVAQLLDDLARRNKTVLVVTHDFELLAACCDSLLLVDNGKVFSAETCNSAMLKHIEHFIRHGAN